MRLSDEVKRIIEHVCSVVHKGRLREVEKYHRDALRYKEVERLPLTFSYPLPEDFPFPPLPNGMIYRSNENMLYNELASAWGMSIAARDLIDDDLPVSIRPNWGTVLVASTLGGFPEQQEDHNPWIRRDDSNPVLLEEITESLFPEGEGEVKNAGWVPRVLETYEFYHSVLAVYPELKDILRITLPDLQGPLDTLEMLRGGELFVEMIDSPEKVKKALIRAAEIQIQCRDLFLPYTADNIAECSFQHGFMVKGNILVRNDTAVMISPEVYERVVSAADEKVLKECGEGGIHSCGKFDQLIPSFLQLDSISSIDFGESYMNNVDVIYKEAAKKEVPLVRVQPTAEELTSGSILKRFPTGVSLLYHANSLDEAKELLGQYRKATEL